MNNGYLINGYYLVSSVDAFKRSENNPLTGTVYTFDEKEPGTIEKLWKDYSKTTLKHVNDFIAAYGLPAFNKAGWTNFTMINTKGGVNA